VNAATKLPASPAFRFVLTMGIVNLFADMTYEGGASINGPFMQSLGATAALVSIVAGTGEFLGYSLRAVAGWLADRTGRYWLITLIGYTINLLAVPAMALVSGWQLAAILILAERTGRAFRKPTVEAMLSYSTGKHGKGWVYAVNTALDETGAMLGPLLIALVLYSGGSFQLGYGVLLGPAVVALLAVITARWIFPVPAKLEAGGPPTATRRELGPAYGLYTLAGALFAAGLMSFEFVSYHLSASGTATEHWIPIFLAIATAVDVVASLILGKL
jgi:MFS family permease